MAKTPHKTAVILPAYNEEDRIGIVLQAIVQAKMVDEILVVSDASNDKTAAVAGQFEGVRVLELPVNTGKGGAMWAGMQATDATILCFIDADLRGLTADHVDRILIPILEDRCDMCIGVFRGGKFMSTTAQRIAPYISGQRAVKREFLEAIPILSEIRMGVEVTINTYVKRRGGRVQRVVLRGVSNTHKEAKLGLVRGVAARTKMYAEIMRAVRRLNRRSKPPGAKLKTPKPPTRLRK